MQNQTRCVLRIELRPAAKAALSDISEQTGMTQVALLSRLVAWLTEQPELIQAAVLGRYPKEIEHDVAELILRRMIERADRA